GGSERPQAPGWLGTPRREPWRPSITRGSERPQAPGVARDAPAEPWRPSRTRQALRSVARAEAPDSPVLHRRDRALPGERVEDEIGEPGTALLADEHSRPSELGEAVAAAEQIARDRDRVGAVGRERLACYLDAHEAAAGRAPRIPHETQARDLEEPAGRAVGLGEPALERPAEVRAAHGELHDDARERQELVDVAPGEGPRGHRAVRPDPAPVHQRDVALEAPARDVGDEVAQVRLSGAKPRPVGLEGHRRAADDDVELALELRRVRLHQCLDDGVGRDTPAHLAERGRALDERTVAGEPQVHPDQVPAVGPRLGDERPAYLRDQRLVLVPTQDHV